MMRTVKIAVLALMAFNGIAYGMEKCVNKYSKCGNYGFHILKNQTVKVFEIKTNECLYEENFDMYVTDVYLYRSYNNQWTVFNESARKVYDFTLVITLQNNSDYDDSVVTIRRDFQQFGNEDIDFSFLLSMVSDQYDSFKSYDNLYDKNKSYA